MTCDACDGIGGRLLKYKVYDQCRKCKGAGYFEFNILNILKSKTTFEEKAEAIKFYLLTLRWVIKDRLIKKLKSIKRKFDVCLSKLI